MAQLIQSLRNINYYPGGLSAQDAEYHRQMELASEALVTAILKAYPRKTRSA